MPTGLYARSLLIIVTPMVILQSVVAFVFMERHWNTVTRRLSAAVTQDIAGLIDVCLDENERRLAGYDPRLLRPNFVPCLMRFARRFMRREILISGSVMV